MARAIRANLPPAVLALFDEAEYPGNGLQALPESGNLKVPTAREISLNYTFLLPVVQANPSKVCRGVGHLLWINWM